MILKDWRKTLGYLVASAIVLIFVLPYKTVIVPEWKLRAVDPAGNPVPHARFRQFWDNDTYGIHGIEFVQADENGYAVLPERAFWLPLAYRIPRSIFALLDAVVAHGSLGNSASLNALSEKCSSKHLSYKEILTLPPEIVIGCQ